MTDPAGQWWTINGRTLLDAIRQPHTGDQPDLIYLELITNNTTEPAEDQ